MSNETKRDVFLQLAKENRGLRMYDPEAIEPKELIEQDHQDWIREYDAALPDDLPVIPKYVVNYIVYWKEQNNSLIDIALESAHTRMDSDDSSEAFDWVHNHFDKFSRAWLDGYEVADD